ncbi:electron transport complex subunit RsxG [Testudinibacter sp. TR-2022]|uniref:electron transport complex subunit RsxG n=1 Tax=Testudinibacter sp. TR-2022 TaxID=2585029 RepID=UPI00111925F6|nr:electron transport complex subunit RsxG [Testudinibacter sp. TR-2022]TNH04610.1 electron transport complex subunit RsxG [Pasteurellaceae bacterium Phil11]TNH22321.1 electron transport complex subunit RsxG [Testudinibacter sp. TR-2022]TNH23672.1 electron transport complex subunit RsxG [Testudinibacter sp. TR-2022]
MLKTTFRSAVILAFVALLCTALSIGVFLLTRDRIQNAALNQQRQLLSQVIPADYFDNALIDACVVPDQKHYPFLKTIYIARKQGEISAYAIKAITNQGYSGRIEILLGIRPDGKVLGVRVLNHKETPGLGDKIEAEKSDWIYRFDQQLFSLENQQQWAVKKDGGKFDQFAGATITPRAVVNAVKQAALTVITDFKQSSVTQFPACD